MTFIFVNIFRGIWNVPYICSVYLMKGTILENKRTRPSYKEDNLDYDMAFSKSLREKVF